MKTWFNGLEYEYDTQVCPEKTETGGGVTYFYAILKDGTRRTLRRKRGGNTGKH